MPSCLAHAVSGCQCSKQFPDMAGLKKHVRIHGDKRCVAFAVALPSASARHTTHFHRHNCPDCGKAFIDSSKLKRHMLVHTKEKKFVCPVANWCCAPAVHILPLPPSPLAPSTLTTNLRAV